MLTIRAVTKGDTPVLVGVVIVVKRVVVGVIAVSEVKLMRTAKHQSP